MKLVILGAPGAGKGTQAHFVSLHYNIPHISTGDLLRDNIKNGTDIGVKVAHLLEKGSLVDDETVITLLKDRIKADDCVNGFLLDGFPRTLKQAEIAESIVGSIDKVISVHVDDSVIIERMDGRRMCSNCGATFHLTYKPPKKALTCDVCGGELLQRDDDKARTVQHRLAIYHKEAEPIKNYFKNLGKLVVVDGVGDIEDIKQNIIAAIG